MPPLRAPARLREDPLWRRAPSRTAHPTPSEQRRRPVPLWAAVHRERAGRPIGPRWPRQAVVSGLGRLAAGVGGAALALLVAGTFATSATSLPDQPLYPMKRLVEDAQLVIAPADSKLELHMQRTQERMKETREMAERDRADVVASLAADYVREVDAVRTELQSDRVRTLEPERVGRVVTSLEANEHTLGALAERVPEPARPAVARAVEASRPEAVTPAVAPAAAPAEVAPPAARVPAAVVPQFGASSPSSAPGSAVDPGQRGTAQQVAEPAASPTPPQVRVPSGAPSILPTPTTGVGASGGNRTTTTAGAPASPATTDANKPDKETAPAAAAPAAPSFGQGPAAGQSGSPATGGAATTSGAGTTSGSASTSGAATTTGGTTTSPGATTSGGATASGAATAPSSASAPSA